MKTVENFLVSLASLDFIVVICAIVFCSVAKDALASDIEAKRILNIELALENRRNSQGVVIFGTWDGHTINCADCGGYLVFGRDNKVAITETGIAAVTRCGSYSVESILGGVAALVLRVSGRLVLWPRFYVYLQGGRLRLLNDYGPQFTKQAYPPPATITNDVVWLYSEIKAEEEDWGNECLP